MQIKVSSEEDPELIDLFIKCFMDDSYYSSLYPDTATRKVVLETEFAESLNFCMKHGCAYKMYDKKLVAYLLFFNYFYFKKSYPEQFEKLFGANDVYKSLNQFDENVVFILSIGVDKQYRNKGLASKLVDKVIKNYKFYSIASDLSNEISLRIFQKRKFNVEKIKDGYFLAYKESKC
jgi:ribosomal protein S18 acetylase RimI-like enzyme